jgi:hypothetical protein
MSKCHLLGEKLQFFLFLSFRRCTPCFVGCRHCSHVRHFQNREAYDDFYSIVEQLVDGGVPTFKEYVVKSLASYLRQHVNDKAADWYV